MEDSDGIEEITHAHDPEKGVDNRNLERVESSTGSDEKGRQQAVERTSNAKAERA